jgi:hypothetical protein
MKRSRNHMDTTVNASQIEVLIEFFLSEADSRRWLATEHVFS